MRSFLYLLLIISCFKIYAQDTIDINQNTFRTTYETIELPSGTKPMGLLGINYLRNTDSNLYYGAGIYSSITGERGGFFCGGVTLGYQYPLTKKILFDAGGFIGGGSGANKKVFGQGLMQRVHGGIAYNANSYQIGSYYSNVTFPNSLTNSNQFGLQLEIPFKTITTNMNNNLLIYKAIEEYSDIYKFDWQDHQFAITYQHYSLSNNAYKNSDKKSIALLGFEYRHYMYENLFTHLEASEAIAGGSAGYAEVLGGMGYNFGLNDNFGLTTKVSLGSAGGASADVEGGLMYKFNAGVYIKPINNLNLNFEMGHVNAPQGDFSALSKKISLGYSIRSLAIGKTPLKNLQFKNITNNTWRLRVSSQRYLSANYLQSYKKNAPIDLVSFKLDRFINSNLYFTGQGFGAFKGDAAGYGGGHLGIGYKSSPLFHKISAYLELLLGTGGAGGVDTGDGLLTQPTLGLNYNISKSLDLQIGAGKVKALSSGNFNENIVEAELVYKFNTIESL